MADNVEKLFQAISGHIAKTVEPLTVRIAALEARQPERGEKGDPGQPGERGEKGDAGPSGERGERGEPGAVGPQGERGDQGPAGERGEKGETGPAGERGEPGHAGIPGPAGPAGVPGERGKDAAEIEILDGMDTARSYPRGTFVAHDGGVFRAFRPTDPLADSTEYERAGWSVVWRGVTSADVSLADDGRTVTMSLRMTGGKTVQRSVQIPSMIYRGVWTDQPYTQGDTVTWDGSLWVRMAGDGQSKPGTDSLWKLSAKRGRDGRDGLRGEKGERGAEGRPGRDLTQLGQDGAKW